ncbi:MAG: abortive infection family protein [bacterium]|nr:abortive infection family protein [bacterium]
MNLNATLPLPNYRRASERWPQAPALAKYHEAISNCIAGDGHGVVEHVKSFIECVCITILGEFGEPLPTSDPTSTQLLGAALKSLGLQNSRGASKLDKILSAFNKLSDALSEMRNENGPVAHGKDGFLDVIEEDHARSFLHTGDAIVGLLLNALEGKQPNLLFTREPYERFKHLCDRIDRSVGIEAEVDLDGAGPVLVVSLTVGGREEAIELRIEPSRLLYGIDRTAFLGVLTEAPEAREEVVDDEAEQPIESGETPPTPTEPSTHPAPPAVVVVGDYSGVFTNLRDGLRSFIVSESISTAPNAELLNSLLATAESNSGVDWQSRENLQARMKIGFRRVLSKEGIAPDKISDASERLLTWLKVNAPADANQI